MTDVDFNTVVKFTLKCTECGSTTTTRGYKGADVSGNHTTCSEAKNPPMNVSDKEVVKTRDES